MSFEKWGKTEFDEWLQTKRGNASRVKKLDLSDTDMKSLPDVFNDFVDLIELDLSDNNLTDIPESVMELKKLKVLNLSNNKLKTIPTSIYKLSNLEVLDIRGNKDFSFPRIMFHIMQKMPKLKSLKHSIKNFAPFIERKNRIIETTTGYKKYNHNLHKLVPISNNLVYRNSESVYHSKLSEKNEKALKEMFAKHNNDENDLYTEYARGNKYPSGFVPIGGNKTLRRRTRRRRSSKRGITKKRTH